MERLGFSAGLLHRPILEATSAFPFAFVRSARITNHEPSVKNLLIERKSSYVQPAPPKYK